ncbi:MAG: xylose isomerase, partial [Christensenellales bacterium]
GFTNGGLNFDAKTRRASNTFEDILFAYIAGMDAFALGLKKAVRILEDGRLAAFVQERYASYNEGVGRRIIEGRETLKTLYEYAKNIESFPVQSGRQEYLESILNDILFS